MNWVDILLHAGAAAAIVVVAALAPPWWVTDITVGYFVAREGVQTKWKYGCWPRQWSGQKLLETFAPTAFLGAAVVTIARAAT